MSNTNSLISLTDVRQFQDVKTVLAETVNNLGSLAPSAKIMISAIQYMYEELKNSKII